MEYGIRIVSKVYQIYLKAGTKSCIKGKRSGKRTERVVESSDGMIKKKIISTIGGKTSCRE